MKLSKILGVAVAAALALMAFAGTASATTLATKGVAENAAITIKASLKTGTSALLTDTFGFFANTCTGSNVEGTTTNFTGATVGGPISTLTFSPCTEDATQKTTVDVKGGLTVTHIVGTTNGTVRSVGAVVTTPSPFGHLECKTAAGEGTDIGILTGVKEGHATMDINAVVSCTIIGSAKWTGTYTVTSPTHLGVEA